MAKNSLYRQLQQQMLILLVDDHDISSHHLLIALPGDNTSTLRARTGKEAIQLAVKHQPDLVLMDISLPDMNGFDAIRSIRQSWPSTKTMPAFVVISAHDLAGQNPELQDLGVSAALQKPVTASEMKTIILAISGRAVPAATSCIEELRPLFRTELLQRLPQLEHHICHLELQQASNLVHQLLASSAMTGEDQLAMSLQLLNKLLQRPEPPAALARAYLRVVERADDFLLRSGGR